MFIRTLDNDGDKVTPGITQVFKLKPGYVLIVDKDKNVLCMENMPGDMLVDDNGKVLVTDYNDPDTNIGYASKDYPGLIKVGESLAINPNGVLNVKNVLKLVSEANQTVTGQVIFNKLPKSSAEPQNNDDIVNKKYVDDHSGGSDNYDYRLYEDPDGTIKLQKKLKNSSKWIDCGVVTLSTVGTYNKSNPLLTKNSLANSNSIKVSSINNILKFNLKLVENEKVINVNNNGISTTLKLSYAPKSGKLSILGLGDVEISTIDLNIPSEYIKCGDNIKLSDILPDILSNNDKLVLLSTLANYLKYDSNNSVTLGTRVSDQAKGTNSLVIGSNGQASGNYSISLGNNSLALADYAIALGYHAANHDNTELHSFVWNGDSTIDINSYKYSHGKGTFTVNPIGGLDGFYVSDRKLSDLLNVCVILGYYHNWKFYKNKDGDVYSDEIIPDNTKLYRDLITGKLFKVVNSKYSNIITDSEIRYSIDKYYNYLFSLAYVRNALDDRSIHYSTHTTMGELVNIINAEYSTELSSDSTVRDLVDVVYNHSDNTFSDFIYFSNLGNATTGRVIYSQIMNGKIFEYSNNEDLYNILCTLLVTLGGSVNNSPVPITANPSQFTPLAGREYDLNSNTAIYEGLGDLVLTLGGEVVNYPLPSRYISVSSYAPLSGVSYDFSTNEVFSIILDDVLSSLGASIEGD